MILDEQLNTPSRVEMKQMSMKNIDDEDMQLEELDVLMRTLHKVGGDS